jgi:CelD/BcsL family acetyltransferase involved in cellulose biosynthesis
VIDVVVEIINKLEIEGTEEEDIGVAVVAIGISSADRVVAVEVLVREDVIINCWLYNTNIYFSYLNQSLQF